MPGGQQQQQQQPGAAPVVPVGGPAAGVAGTPSAGYPSAGAPGKTTLKLYVLPSTGR